MKKPAMFLSFALASGMAAQAAAPDPFQRQVPPQTAPVLRGTAATTLPTPASATTRATPTPLTLSGVQNATFGNPRISNSGSQTRVVFDLSAGVTYTLTPTFTGLRLDVQGARVLPAVTARLGNSINEYRAGGGQATLITPFPLSLTEGWRATEATLGTGARVLILEFGATVAGGASNALQASVRTTAPLSASGTANAEANAVLNAPLSNAAPSTPSPSSATASRPATAATPLVDQLPPGDNVTPGKLLPPAPAISDPAANQPNVLTGRVPGSATSGAVVGSPRIGKSPGMTRLVLDLPPGITYRIEPSALGLQITLGNVGTTAQSGQSVSPELRTWRLEPSVEGASFSIVTGTPTTARSGWRGQLLPPTPGSDRSRLVLDLSPALADLTPLTPSQRVVAAVPPLPATRGTAILALSAAMVQPRVVIDPGHGGRDPGAVASIIEKEVTLAIGLRVRDLLRAAGVDVVMTRDSDRELSPSKNTDLQLRAAMGTPGTQLFVSIHVNALEANTALRGYGIETWWNPNHPLSSSLAGLLQRHMVEQTGAFSRGLKNSQSLAVLRNSRVPAALVEVGYTSHPVDGLNLQNSNYLDRVALGIAQGIREAIVSGITAGGAVGGGGK